MSKSLILWACIACLSTSGCASPITNMFAKKPQPFDEYLAQRKAAEQNRVASGQQLPNPSLEVAELLNKGHAAFQQGQIADAQANYVAVLQRQPQHPVANHRLAVIADRQHDFLTAERHYQAALSAAPHDANLLNDVGYSYLMQSRLREAEHYLQLALQQNPTQANAINNLGLLYAQQGQPDRALTLFRRSTSEAEAQAKVAQLTQNRNVGATAPVNSLNANAWPAQPTALPTQPAMANQLVNHQAQWPNSIGTRLQSGGVASVPNNNPTASLVNDPSQSDPTRQLRELMEYERLKAVAERQARDDAERARRDGLLRQFQADDQPRSSVVPASGTTAGSINQWSNPQRQMPSGPQPAMFGAGSTPTNSTTTVTSSNSPLDAMPTWPVGDPSLPPNANAATIANNSAINVPSNTAWPTSSPAVVTDDPSRAASRLGMNFGTGNLFPIVPGQTASDLSLNSAIQRNAIPSASLGNMPTNWPSAPNSFSGTPPHSGLSRQNPSATAINAPPAGFQNPLPQRPFLAQPPAGAFGSGNLGILNYGSALGDSPSHQALRDQVPPSEQYQTPAPFNSIPNRPIDASRSINKPSSLPAVQNDASMSSIPATNASAPTWQGFVPRPTGDHSMNEYEKMIQQHNYEANLIRQQIDAQRQLPGSENYSNTAGQFQNTTAISNSRPR